MRPLHICPAPRHGRRAAAVCERSAWSFIRATSFETRLAVGDFRTATHQRSPSPSNGDTTGWYIWGGQELSSAGDFSSPFMATTLTKSCAIILPRTTAGWRFQIAPVRRRLVDGRLIDEANVRFPTIPAISRWPLLPHCAHSLAFVAN